MELDNPLYPISLAAQATLMVPATLRMWFHRKRVVLTKGSAEFEPALVPDKVGVPRLLTLRTVLTLGVATALVRTGADAAVAFDAAKAWTYRPTQRMGSGEVLREAAALFPGAVDTVLVFRGTADAQVTGVAVTAEGAKDISAVRFPMFHAIDSIALLGRDRDKTVSPIIVWLDHIDAHVRSTCQSYLERVASNSD